jgi:hypothetical protein
VDIFGKGGCPFSAAERLRDDKKLTKACKKYVENLAGILLDGNYDLIVTSQASGVEWIATNNESQQETAIRGLDTIWTTLVSKGIPVLAIKDNPRPVPKVIRCLEVNTPEKCNPSRDEAFLFDPQVGAVERIDSELVSLVEFDDVYCDKSTCFSVIGNVVVYRDANHLTSTFTRTLARFLSPYIESALAK